MSSHVLSQPVLVLNRSWEPISDRATVESILVDMTGQGRNGRPSKLGMHVELVSDGNGGFHLGEGTRPIEWDEWMTLAIRTDHHDDRVVHTHRFTWRAPTVAICTDFGKMPFRKRALSSQAIWDRDGSTCQYTGEKLTRATGDLDHVIPRDRGGRDTFENLVLSLKKVNRMKSNRLNSEAGLSLLREPKAPKPVPASVLIKVPRHVTWIPFLIS